MRIEFVDLHAPTWRLGAALIEAHFRSVYAARISVPAIRLAVAHLQDGRIGGAAGIRGSEQGFFSEIYLNRPIAALLSDKSGQRIAPEDILEVVSMACPQPRATLPLIEAITEEGRRRGKSWGIFTATTPLMRLLSRVGVPLIALAPARPERLPQAEAWGSYYATEPWVCALPDEGRSLHFQPRRPGLTTESV